MTNPYGFMSTSWRPAPISRLEPPVQPDCQLIGDVLMPDTVQGQGVGTKLLTTIRNKACTRGLSRIQLDVINTNPKVLTFCGRFGFVAQSEEHLGLFRNIFGFLRQPISFFLLQTQQNRSPQRSTLTLAQNVANKAERAIILPNRFRRPT